MKTGGRYKVEGERYWRKVLVVVCLLCSSILSFAQRIVVSLDRDKIVIGEQVNLQLKVVDVNDRLSFLPKWFTLGDTVNHLTIIKKGNVDTVDVGGLATYLQQVTVTSFDSGKWALPVQNIVLQDRATGKQTTLKADSVFLQVLPVDVSGLKDYHDVKEIIDVPVKPDYTLWIAAGISAIVVTALVILLLRRKNKPKPVAIKKAPKTSRPPLEEALYQLKELDKQNLPATGQTKQYYVRIDEICREYFEARLQIQIMQLTSDELLPALSVYLQAPQAKADYKQLLQLIDAVKFAKYTPPQQDNIQALQLAAATLEHFERQLQISRQHVN